MSSLYFDLTLLRVIPTVEIDVLVSTYCHPTEESSIGEAYTPCPEKKETKMFSVISPTKLGQL